MVRFFVSAVALAGLLATAHPASADPAASTAPEPNQISVPAQDQSAPAPARTPAAAETAAPLGSGFIPVGIGWG